MKELDQFTVEQLEKYAKPEALTLPPSHAQVAALARIALAAKASQPVQWWTGPEPTSSGEMESCHDHETGSHYIPLIPALGSLNSPVIPDGWVACAERMPREGDYVIVAPDGGVTQCVTYFWEDCPINGRPMWFTHSEECEPVPLAEFTHWMPLPAAPKPEK